MENEPKSRRGLEDAWRADTYALLARLLSTPPDETLTTILQDIEGTIAADSSPLAQAWVSLSSAAEQVPSDAIDDDYHRLFVGVTGGQLLPYASWYLTGFLMEKPLASLRDELAQLGITRQPGQCEPEDHVSGLCESMAILIQEQDSRQQTFFATHLSPWIDRFFTDLTRTATNPFYKSVGKLGNAFIAFERDWLDSVPTV